MPAKRVAIVGSGADAARALGEAVRDARRDAGLTQAELGEFVGGAPRQLISELERGHLTRQAQRLLDIFEVVGIELELRPRSIRLADADQAGDDPAP